jgi:Putative sugar-binding domain
VRRALMSDASVSQVVERWPHLTVALLGISSPEPSRQLRRSGNAITEDEQKQLRERGARTGRRHRPAPGTSVPKIRRPDRPARNRPM